VDRGNDTLDVRDGGPDTANCGADSDTVTADMLGVDVLTGCENVSFLPTPATGGSGGGTVLAFGEKTHVSLKLAAGRIPARGPLKIRVANANGLRSPASCRARRPRRCRWLENVASS
jgi:hypothetical protein